MRTSTPAPHSQLVTENGLRHLYVNEKRFVVLGGELHNSSSSTVPAIHDAFARLRGMNLNTVLAPVSWGQFEPVEGQYDFTLIDELISTARRHGLKLVPLWFGAWKNGVSTYMPSWVRANSPRFPRAHVPARNTQECLSPFSSAVTEADTHAFAALMAHIRAVDTDDGTVVMVQVENEVGILGDSRDRSELAEQHFNNDVPADVLGALASPGDLRVRAAWEDRGRLRSGTWMTVLGESADTDEAFMAAAYARHVEQLAAAGKAEYPIPLFVNTWLYTDVEVEDGTPAGGQRPGVYPSGGPVPHVAGIWTTLAPSLDLLTPDIYFGDFPQICRDYQSNSGAVFIPEMRRDVTGVADGFVALGSFAAIGMSPFGIDTLDVDEGAALVDAYESLSILLRTCTTPPSAGFRLDSDAPEQQICLGTCTVTVRREPNRVNGFYELGYGLIVQETQDTFLIAGRGTVLTFTNEEGNVELAKVDELALINDQLQVYRELNGDETESGTLVLLPSLEPRATSDAYQIPTVRRRSGVVRVHLTPRGAAAASAR